MARLKTLADAVNERRRTRPAAGSGKRTVCPATPGANRPSSRASLDGCRRHQSAVSATFPRAGSRKHGPAPHSLPRRQAHENHHFRHWLCRSRHRRLLRRCRPSGDLRRCRRKQDRAAADGHRSDLRAGPAGDGGAQIGEGRLSFTSDGPAAVRFGTSSSRVGTPPEADGSADLSHVLDVAGTIGANIDAYKVIVNKSTVPVGTADLVATRSQPDWPGAARRSTFDVVLQSGVPQGRQRRSRTS